MISVVIPVYNERDSLVQLHAELMAVAAKARHDLEIFIVDDGSTDGSWNIIADLAGNDSRLTGISFASNFGRAPLLSPGFRSSNVVRILTLGDDSSVVQH